MFAQNNINKLKKSDFLEALKSDLNVLKIHGCEAVQLCETNVTYTLEEVIDTLEGDLPTDQFIEWEDFIECLYEFPLIL